MSETVKSDTPWKNAITMNTGVASAVIAPETGRIISYSIDGKEFLFINESELGKKYDEANADEWHNFGGIRFEAAPQSSWKKTSWNLNWPPPPIFNTYRIAKNTNDGVIMKTPHDITNHLKIDIETRLISIRNSSIIKVEQSIINLGNSTAKWSNWIIAQIKAIEGQTTIHVKTKQKYADAPLYDIQFGDSPKKIAYDKKTELISTKYDGKEWKLGMRSSGWICCKKTDITSMVFAIIFPVNANAKYPDNGVNAECYSSSHMPYIEIEALSELSDIEPKARKTSPFLLAVTTIDGDIHSINDLGIVSVPLHMEKNKIICGNFGTFYVGIAELIGIADGRDNILESIDISPHKPISLRHSLNGGFFDDYRIDIRNESGHLCGILDFFHKRAL